MYFPFSELRKWSKKTAETRRRNCAVLPLITSRNMYRVRSVNPIFMRLFRIKNLVLSGVPFFIVIDHKVNPVCDRIDRIRFESVLPRRGWHRE